MPSPLVVQKYGGSSVANADRIRRVARRIARERAAGSRLVVVVSAMGDTTDELLSLAAAITDDPDPRELDMLLATGEHQAATLVSMALHALGVPAISLTGPQAGIVTDGRFGKARIAGIDPRRVQAELAAGKVVIVAGFQGMSQATLPGAPGAPGSATPASTAPGSASAPGVPSAPPAPVPAGSSPAGTSSASGGPGTPGDGEGPGEARAEPDGEARAEPDGEPHGEPRAEAQAESQAFHPVHLAEVTTLGRGGSDTTAVALAARLRADRCQIFTDVRGIYTADPRIVPEARQLRVIGYEEMLELAHQGAQVMQTRAVELGWVNGVVIEVLSSFEDAPGTLIKEDPFVEQRNKVRGLAHDRNVAKVTLVEVPDRPGVAAAVFEPLAEAGINVDMIVQNVGHHGKTDLSFTVARSELARTKRILEPLAHELGFREIATDASLAKVSIVGAGIQNSPGYAARMFRTLADEGINIEMITTSEIRITCTIAEEMVERAVRALHRAFQLERPDPVDEVEAAGSGEGLPNRSARTAAEG